MIDIETIIDIAKQAGETIMEIYARDFVNVDMKGDNSPLTEADRRANDIIIKGLQKNYPNIPYISEEAKALDYKKRKDWDKCWLIDPLDGTKEFLNKNGEFTVNIGLVKQGVPVLGVVYVPAKQLTYYAYEGIAYKRDIGGHNDKLENTGDSLLDKEEITVVASRSHLSEDVLSYIDALKEKGKKVKLLSVGSSLKICMVAEGRADIYPRLGPTMEWDTCAAHAVALASGRNVYVFKKEQSLIYNKEQLINPKFVVS